MRTTKNVQRPGRFKAESKGYRPDILSYNPTTPNNSVDEV